MILDTLIDKLEKVYFETEKKSTGFEKVNNIFINKNLFYSIFTEILLEHHNEIIIGIDYQTIDIAKNIKESSNWMNKLSNIIFGFHKMVYNILSNENYKFSLDAQEEMAVIKEKKTYYIHISEKNENNIYFCALILIFGLESLYNKHLYVGIDYEFTNREIRMAQLNFENKYENRSQIMIVSPPEISSIINEDDMSIMDIFVHMIIINNLIKKILHGSDSLDIPYMFTQMLENDRDKIFSFVQSMIDTRFLCEYYKLNLEGKTDHKCSIYDAVHYFGVINDNQYQKLNDLLASMPPVHDIVWTIKKLPISQIKYAQYDVLYLKYFYYKIINSAIHLSPEEPDKITDNGHTMILYKKILYELTHFCYLESNALTDLVTRCKMETDPINNYMVQPKKRLPMIPKLVDLFKEHSVGVTTSNPFADIDRICKVNYFKKPILTILKKILYTVVCKRYNVFISKGNIWLDGKNLNNSMVFDYFKELNYEHLYRIFREIERIFIKKIEFVLN